MLYYVFKKNQTLPKEFPEKARLPTITHARSVKEKSEKCLNLLNIRNT